MGILGNSLYRNGKSSEALPVLEANLALVRRYFSRSRETIFSVQTNLSNCLDDLGRNDEALALKREIYARSVATLGVSHEDTIISGNNLVISLDKLGLGHESQPLLRDQLLPAARRSLGSDHALTLALNQNLAAALQFNPKRTRDDLLEAETITQDVLQRRRRVFGPAHPETRKAERALSGLRAQLAARTHA